MTARAFILARPYDYPIAERCAEALYWQGWTPAIMLSPDEWLDVPAGAVLAEYGTQGRGMYGNCCAESILAGVLANSKPGDIVAKFDCDIRMTDAASAWLMDGPARAFVLAGKPWGGCWSAPRSQVFSAAEMLRIMPRCKCPESLLILKALMRSHAGLHTTQAQSAAKWIPGRAWPIDAAAITLPSVCHVASRGECGAALFDFRP